MFRRLWSGLPADPHFPSDLRELGYFVSAQDEIRNMGSPDHYFKYFLSRNERHNERQRFAMNEACEKLVHSRLTALGLEKIAVPLFADCTPEGDASGLDFLRGNSQFQQLRQIAKQRPDMLETMLHGLDAGNPQLGRLIRTHGDQLVDMLNEDTDSDVNPSLSASGSHVTGGTGQERAPAHIPIFISKDCYEKSRVVIIIGESYQDLGILAHRVLGGQGGVDEGSLVSVVRLLQQQQCSATDRSPPGIVIANTGQTIWSPELKRSLTIAGSEGAPMPSAVHAGMYIDQARNHVRENRSVGEHIEYIFEKVRGFYINPEAGLDIIGIGDGADMTENYLNQDQTWNKLGRHINCFAVLGGFYDSSELQCERFRKFMRETGDPDMHAYVQKAQAWVTSSDPLGTMISGPDGNPDTATFTSLGCPVFSSGEEYYVERALIRAKAAVCAFLQQVALVGRDYANMEIEVDYKDPELPEALKDPDWSRFGSMSEEEIEELWKLEMEEAGTTAVLPVMNNRVGEDVDKLQKGMKEQGIEQQTIEAQIQALKDTPDYKLYD